MVSVQISYVEFGVFNRRLKAALNPNLKQRNGLSGRKKVDHENQTT